MLGFVERPDDLTELCADRTRIAKYVEESLRKEPSVHGILRLTTVDAEIGGVKVPRGSMVLLLPGSANHDPSVFAAPERFDAGRSTQGNFAFRLSALPYGKFLYELGGRVAVDRVPANWQLTNSPDEEDYPAAAAGSNVGLSGFMGGGYWMASSVM